MTILKRPSRREFLKGLALLAASPSFRVAAQEEINARTFILGTVRQNLGHLKIDDAGLERFAADMQILWAGSVHHRKQAARHPHESVLEHFLLSTDFFKHGMDESNPVRYLGLYNPYLRLCANPIARLSGE